MKEKSNKKKVVIWIVLTSIFGIFSIAASVGSYFTNSFKNTINSFFGLKDYEIIREDGEKGDDIEYFKSNYVFKDGNGNPITVNDDGYVHQKYDSLSLLKAGRSKSYEIQREGSVLLWNNTNNNTEKGLPLKKGDKVSFFGKTTVQYVNSGDGSGNAYWKYSTGFPTKCQNVGLEINAKLRNFYTTGGGKNYKREDYKAPNEVPWSEYESDPSLLSTFSTYGDAAIVSFSRRAGEFSDIATNDAGTISGDYCGLSKEEKELLEHLISYKNSGVFKKIILLLNTARGMNFNDLMPYKENIDTCMWVGQPGIWGIDEIASMLVGDSYPSGHLTDTFVYNGKSAPAYNNLTAKTYNKFNEYKAKSDDELRKGKYIVYAENIYVGYKYYETRYEDCVLNNGNANCSKGVSDPKDNKWNYAKEVAFPFGFGLSYTTFEHTNHLIKKINGTNDYEVSVKITNTGTTAGKDVVQVYIQKPYSEYDKTNHIEQASVNLCGFAKTKELQPNESQELKIVINYDAFKTYDANNKKTYIREKTNGNCSYFLTIAKNSHDAINNILSAKGKTVADGMDNEGNPSATLKIDFANDDFSSFAISSNGTAITNKFNETDWNTNPNKSEENITYLSRKDWDSTYPTSSTSLSLNDKLWDCLKDDSVPLDNSEKQMPKYGENNNKSLISLKGRPYDDEEWTDLLNQLTFEETIELLGKAIYGTRSTISIVSLGTEANDGPLGIRKRYLAFGDETKIKDENNEEFTNITTSFPIIPLFGSSFNSDLVYQAGQIMGEDLLHSGQNGLYAPCANIHRTQYGGRMYEYFSEDPFLSGQLCKVETIGIQETGNYVTLKHFALNEQESNRQGVGIWANEQSIRELYLEAFRPAVEEGKAKSVMSSFTRFGTSWSGATSSLNNEVLRKEWGFDGFVLSDCPYFSYMGILNGLIGGNDCILYELKGKQLEPYETGLTNAVVANAMRESAHRILYVTVNSNAMNGVAPSTTIRKITNSWEYLVIAIITSFTILTFTFGGLWISALRKNERLDVTINEKNNLEVVKNKNIKRRKK